jgi:hypothetical protein
VGWHIGGGGSRQQHLREVGLQKPRIRCPRLRLDRELHVADLELEGCGKGTQHAQSTSRDLLSSLESAQPEQELPQRGDQHLGQPASLRGFQQDRLVVLLFGQVRDAVEQDGLADPAQTQQELTLGRAA